jgi:hypothetical protein
VRLLTRWGIAGGTLPSRPLALIAFTTTVPVNGAPAAVIVGATGARVRTATGCVGRSPAGPDDLASPAVVEALRGAAVIAVTAEAGVTLARVVEVLTQLDPLGRPITLAVALDSETRLPEPAAAGGTDPDAGMCPSGLPQPDPSAAEGVIHAPALTASLGTFRTAAQRCLASATGPGAAGGRLTLAFRIAADGRVAHACAIDDATRDSALRACVLESLRAIQFAAPDPAGWVDAQLPLVLRADETLAQRPLCR